MKHAIAVLGSGNDASVLQALIKHFDDPEIDFFIHWDKKFNIPELKSRLSKIMFIPSIKVYWGTDTLVRAEKNLMEAIFNKGGYDYIHLISSSDIPLMTKSYFKQYFRNPLYVGYVKDPSAEKYRLSYYFPFHNMNVRGKKIYIGTIKKINSILHINRLKNKKVNFQKGCEWFSIHSDFLPKLLNYPNMEIFNHTFLADETFVQTVLYKYKPQNINCDDNTMAARYIDWRRGKPYVFDNKDLSELKNVVNTKYAFARKVNDASLVNEIFK